MFIAPALLETMKQKRFWADWLWLTESDDEDTYAEHANREEPWENVTPDEREFLPLMRQWIQFDIPIAGRYFLVLTASTGLHDFNLSLREPDGKETQLGWDDQAHWHPHSLRWEEVDTFCRCIALREPLLPHPGIPLLLLARFAPVSHGEDPGTILPLIESAWRSIGVDKPKKIRNLVDHFDRRHAGFTWQQVDGLGWTLDQSDKDDHDSGCGLYSLRRRDCQEFPFAALAKAWSRRNVNVVEPSIRIG